MTKRVDSNSGVCGFDRQSVDSHSEAETSQQRSGSTAKEKRVARQQARDQKKGQSKGNSDRPGTTADGKQLCYGWNRNEKGCVDGPCPSKRVHLCEKCGGQHRGVNCSAPAADKKSS